MSEIDNYIEEEKSVSHSPYLATRILSRIERLEDEHSGAGKKVALWQATLVALSIAMVAVAGLKMGGSYRQGNADGMGFMVNDQYLENLSIYTADENE